MHQTEMSVRSRIAHNITGEFKETLESELRWGADMAWREVADPKGIGSPPVTQEEIKLELDALARGRRLQGCRALMRAAKLHGVPVEYRHVGGGHSVAFAQFGSVILCTEAVRYVEQRPETAEYKLDLARGNQELLQLELPFEHVQNRLDPRGVLFCIVQHLVPLTSMERADCLLSGLSLVVPDLSFTFSIVAENIIGEHYQRNILLHGEQDDVVQPQEDKVVPKLRARSAKRRKDDIG